jgi:steroid 5-alpha reductase family enzyme
MNKNFKNFVLSIFIISFVSLIGFLAGKNGDSFYSIPLLLVSVVIIFLIQWIMFVPSYLKSTEHFFDLTGSVTFIIAALFSFFFNENINIRSIILITMILLWAIRLGFFLFKRVKTAGSDGRFDNLKDFSTFFMVWNLQALWITFTLLGALIILTSDNQPDINIYDYIGLSVWIIGFVIEIISDTQKSRFKNDIKNKDQFINTGLWKISRHPNYVGEITLWLGITIISVPILSGWSWLGFISPIFVYIMLKYISGVRILEERADSKWANDKNYQKYKKNTPELFPFKIG